MPIASGQWQTRGTMAFLGQLRIQSFIWELNSFAIALNMMFDDKRLNQHHVHLLPSSITKQDAGSLP